MRRELLESHQLLNESMTAEVNLALWLLIARISNTDTILTSLPALVS